MLRSRSRRRCGACASRTCSLQSVVSILNLTARRIAKEDERDLEQARVGIDAVRALVDLLDPEAQNSRKALSQLQMLYAQRRPAARRRARRGRGAGAAPESRRRRARLSRRRQPAPEGREAPVCGPLTTGPARLRRRFTSASVSPGRSVRKARHLTGGKLTLTDFLTDYGVVIALVCAGAAVLYGALVTQRLLAQSPGNERMQEISGAVQEGAKAYLNAPVHDHRRASPFRSRSCLAILQDHGHRRSAS